MTSLAGDIPGTEGTQTVVSRKVFVGPPNGVLTELSNEIGLFTITINKSHNKVAFAKMSFRDGSMADRDFELSGSDSLKPGNQIKVQLGYEGEVETVFEGIVVKHGIKIRRSGPSLLLIEAKDKAIKLTGARKSAYHIDKTDSEVMTELAGSLQKTIEETTFTHKQLVQFNVTDWDFIVTRAEANGMLVFTDDGTLVVKKPSTSGEPICTVTYGDNLWEIEAEVDTRNHAKQIVSQSWNYAQQQLDVSGESTIQFTDTGNFTANDMGGVLESEIKLLHSGNLTEEQLNDWTNAHSIRTHLGHAVGRVRIQGRANIKPGELITLAGVGDRFNGNVFVTGILHHYEGQWQTDVQFGWRDEWFYRKEDIMDKPASGLLPGVNGLQIGIVKDVDDQEGQYRVKVHAPLITSEANKGIWARVATLDAGANHGVYFRPQEDDEVIIGFLNDDPREPIILGYLHSNDTKQSPLPEEEGALQYGIVTKEGNKLIFDDSNKSIKLSIQAGSGEKTLFMDNNSGAFEMKDEHQNMIKMDTQGITIQAGSGKNITISGTQVAIN
ncbi:type VI secretion system tip protein VgrG [Cellulophaga baltica]|uniref:type VI secretion system tip protein VgrG n=1 Tax=Cellulophaga baltica TaxID=76594 RepID=UPI002147DA81|nr:type VI secretion system tip protein VgrG [Cellulophaga baltica]MCR1024522.1 type VI secretion system tip protein VgrG [Cellulophaga baltica]